MKYATRFSRWLLALPLLAGAWPAAQAQTPDRRSSFGLNLNAIQYRGDYGSDYWQMDRNRYAPGIAINQYLGRGLDLNTQFFYVELNGARPAANARFNSTVLNANLALKFKLNNGWALKETSFFQPYLVAGPGWTYVSRIQWSDNVRTDVNKSFIDLYAGAGINFRLGGGVGLFVQSGQHTPLDGDLDGIRRADDKDRWDDRFLQHTVGLTFNLGQARDADEDDVPDRLDRCPNTPPGVPVDSKGCPLDGDSDNVPDYQDQCPDVPGLASLQGCPDKDEDGIIDGDDACPDVAGKAELQGCPDTDGDGVPDQEDKCADTPAGTQVTPEGCPVAPAPAAEPAPAPTPDPATTDTDGDGVPNAADRCPTSAGPASNQGCPVVRAETRRRLSEATRAIRFEPNRATLVPTSFATLSSIAQVLREYPDYSLSIAGHTDSKGTAATNLRLSRERAAAARRYLAEQGIEESRLDLRGYGPVRPVVPNTTEAGRARNRRVEFDLFLTGDPNPAQAKYGPEPTGSVTPKAPVRKAPARKAPAKKGAVGRRAVPAKAATARPAAPARAAAKPAPQAPASRPDGRAATPKTTAPRPRR